MDQGKIGIISISCFTLLLFCASLVDAEDVFRQWESLTSALETKAMAVYNGDVYTATTGGLIRINPTDMTYRIYDWDRVGVDGKPRELHIEHALNVLDYKTHASYKTSYKNELNTPVNLVTCPYFSTQLIQLDRDMDMDYASLDSFIIYMCLDGDLEIRYDGDQRAKLVRGDSILIPAALKDISLEPEVESSLLEIYL